MKELDKEKVEHENMRFNVETELYVIILNKLF